MEISTSPVSPVSSQRTRLAFTIGEVCISIAVLAVMMVSLYGGMSSCFSLTQSARENLRATQIMIERVEGLRLFNWNQLVYSNTAPTTFTSYFYPLAGPGESKGTVYSGTMSIVPASLNPPATYSNNMRTITVNVYWTNYYGRGMTNKLVRTRSIKTYTARDGIQNYVFYN